MGKDIYYTRKKGQKLTDEEIAMLDFARSLPVEYDEDNPEINPVESPEQYTALMKAVSERNQRIEKKLRDLA